MINLTGAAVAVDALAGALTVRSYADGQYVDGEYVIPLAPTSRAVRGFVTHPSPNAVRDLPEGIREETAAVVWTRTELKGPDPKAGKVGDELFWNGEWYKILMVQPRREGGFTKAYLGVIRDHGRSL